MNSKFTPNDPRGEYWLYTDGALTVDVGRGGTGGSDGCHVNTSEVHIQSGGPITVDQAAEILLEFLEFLGDQKGGFKKLTLHNDGVYTLTEAHFEKADIRLARLGFIRSANGSNWVEWKKQEER